MQYIVLEDVLCIRKYCYSYMCVIVNWITSLKCSLLPFAQCPFLFSYLLLQARTLATTTTSSFPWPCSKRWSATCVCFWSQIWLVIMRLLWRPCIGCTMPVASVWTHCRDCWVRGSRVRCAWVCVLVCIFAFAFVFTVRYPALIFLFRIQFLCYLCGPFQHKNISPYSSLKLPATYSNHYFI